jgi:hypothetical protein
MGELKSLSNRVEESLKNMSEGVERINEGLEKIDIAEKKAMEAPKTPEMSPTKNVSSRSTPRKIPMDQWDTEFSIIRDGLMSQISFTTTEFTNLSEKIKAIEAKLAN